MASWGASGYRRTRQAPDFTGGLRAGGDGSNWVRSVSFLFAGTLAAAGEEGFEGEVEATG